MPARALRRLSLVAQIFASTELLNEYRSVPEELLRSGKITVDQWQILLAGIAAFVADARIVRVTHHLDVCRDPSDNMVVECCLAANADLLVTGDRDLLEIETDVLREAGLPKLRILPPRSAMSLNL